MPQALSAVDYPHFAAFENDYNVFTPAEELMGLAEERGKISLQPPAAGDGSADRQVQAGRGARQRRRAGAGPFLAALLQGRQAERDLSRADRGTRATCCRPAGGRWRRVRSAGSWRARRSRCRCPASRPRRRCATISAPTRKVLCRPSVMAEIDAVLAGLRRIGNGNVWTYADHSPQQSKSPAGRVAGLSHVSAPWG